MKKRTKKVKKYKLQIILAAMVFLFVVALLLLFKILGSNNQWSKQANEGRNVPAKNEISEWKSYHDDNYQFDIKYPANWEDPRVEFITDPDFVYDYEVRFGSKDAFLGNSTDGFSIFVYKKAQFNSGFSISKKIVPNELEKKLQCFRESKLKNSNEMPGKHFYDFFGRNYAYVLAPLISKDGTDSFDELEEISKTFSFNETVELKLQNTPAQPSPISQAPARRSDIPVQSSLYPRPAFGTRVCPVVNDHPSRSSYKSRHIDEDCCPDYDEYPNPNCVYSSVELSAVLLKGSIPARLVKH